MQSINPRSPADTRSDANMQLQQQTILVRLFHDKIFALTLARHLATFLTFSWQVSKFLAFPGFPDKWSLCKSTKFSSMRWFKEALLGYRSITVAKIWRSPFLVHFLAPCIFVAINPPPVSTRLPFPFLGYPFASSPRRPLPPFLSARGRPIVITLCMRAHNSSRRRGTGKFY